MKKFFLLAGIAGISAVSCTPATQKGSEAQKQAMLAEGKTVFENSCARCHDLPDPKSHNDQEWIGIMNVMAPKAKLTDKQSELVYNYVTSVN